MSFLLKSVSNAVSATAAAVTGSSSGGAAAAAAVAAKKLIADPDKYWNTIGKTAHKVIQVKPNLGTTPQPPNTVRFVCVSDTHSLESSIPYLPAGDVLLHAGDFTDVGAMQDLVNFNKWLGSEQITSKYRHKIVIAGNHGM